MSNTENLQKEIEEDLNEPDKNLEDHVKSEASIPEKKNRKPVLESKGESLQKLMILLQKGDIDEDQLRDIIRHMKEEGMHITWNHAHEEILKSIGEKSATLHCMHRLCHFYFKKEHAFFTMPMFILSLMASFGNFASYKWIDEDNSMDMLKYSGLVTGSMNLLVAVLQKVMEFRQPEYLSIENKNASQLFQGISDEIRIQLALPRPEREPMPQYLNYIVKRYSEALKISPEISPLVLNKAKKYTKDNQKFQDGIELPDILTGPKPIKVFKNVKIIEVIDNVSNIGSDLDSEEGQPGEHLQITLNDK